MESLDNLLKEAELRINESKDAQALNQCRVFYLGKKGRLTEILKSVGQMPIEKRPELGKKINQLKETITDLLETRADFIKRIQIEEALSKNVIDVTLPGRTQGFGSIHPITQTFAELKRIFSQLGFFFMDGPEVETDYYNFTALNIPPFHPARAMQDTFYFPDGRLLRSQMSPVQIHAMKKFPPPLRMAALGRVYRRDFDLTHTPMFHQMECLMIDKKLSFAQLKGFLSLFLHEFFDADAPIRFRPSYFPFTEPSAEVDIGCMKCKGKGCRICKHTGWLEVLGCGMVHPNVLREVEINPDEYQGFAFGLGIDRLTLLKYGISDLRALFENDVRFLNQF